MRLTLCGPLRLLYVSNYQGDLHCVVRGDCCTYQTINETYIVWSVVVAVRIKEDCETMEVVFAAKHRSYNK